MLTAIISLLIYENVFSFSVIIKTLETRSIFLFCFWRPKSHCISSRGEQWSLIYTKNLLMCQQDAFSQTKFRLKAFGPLKITVTGRNHHNSTPFHNNNVFVILYWDEMNNCKECLHTSTNFNDYEININQWLDPFCTAVRWCSSTRRQVLGK